MKTPQIFVLLLLLSLSSSGFAQSGCVDPPAPDSYVAHKDIEFVLSDGYRTLADVRIPKAPPGPCGWPVLVLIHGSGFGKDQMGPDAQKDSRQGFATITYDVRGQGASMALNDPAVYGRGPLGLRERMDLFEVIEAVAAYFPNEIDINRIAVTGKSQGSFLTWCAAAHSGRVPPPNPWRTAPFPTIAAIIPRNNPTDLKSGSYPQGTSATEKHIKSLYKPLSGVHHDPVFFAQQHAFLMAEDYASLFDIPWGPGLDVVELLKTSTVPSRITVSYDDVHFPANCITDTWAAILPNTPKLLNITTGGHSTPKNGKEERVKRLRRQQWLHRFLRGQPNGVEDSPEVRMSIRPENRMEYNSLNSLWDNREFTSWPPPTTDYTLWLNGGGDLLETLTTSGFVTVQNVWNIPYTIADYVQELPLATEVQSYIPLDFAAWISQPFSQDRMMLGKGSGTIWLETMESDFQVNLSLYDVDLGGNSTFICSGATTVRGNQNFAPQPIDVDLSVYGYVFRKGHNLKLRVENLAWNRPPGGGEVSTLRSLPVFDDFYLKIKYGANSPSSLRLPILPIGNPVLVCSDVKLHPNGIKNLYFGVHTSSARAGMNYSILAGKSGTFPGSIWNGLHVDLNQDVLTRAVSNDIGIFGLVGFSGVLDQDGRATAFFNLPTMGQAFWYLPELDFVAVVYDNNGSIASNAVVLGWEG